MNGFYFFFNLKYTNNDKGGRSMVIVPLHMNLFFSIIIRRNIYYFYNPCTCVKRCEHSSMANVTQSHE